LSATSRSFVAFSVTREDDAGTVRVVVTGEVDVATADAVEQAVQGVSAAGPDAILLDLSGVTFIDSTGLRILLTLARTSRENGNRLAMITSPPVDRVIDLADVRRFLPLV